MISPKQVYKYIYIRPTAVAPTKKVTFMGKNDSPKLLLIRTYVPIQL